MNVVNSKLNTPIRLSGNITLPLYSTTTMNSKNAEKKAKNGLTMPKIFADGGLLPYLPASQIKGALRRAAVRTILERQGVVLTTAEDYYFNMVGGVKGAKDDANKEDKKTSGSAAEGATDEAEESEPDQKVSGSALLKLRKYLPDNPVQQLFGSGDLLGNFYPGHLYVTNAIPESMSVTEQCTDGTRTDDARVRPDLMMATSSELILGEVERMFEANKNRTETKNKMAEIAKKIRQAKKEKDKEAEDCLTAEKAALKKSMDKENAVSMPWGSSYASFSKPLPTRLTLSRDASLVELGLLLAAMDWQMRNDPFYGGHKTLGFGEFSAEYTCGADNKIILLPFVEAEIIGPLFKEAMDAFDTAVASFSLASPNEKKKKVTGK